MSYNNKNKRMFYSIYKKTIFLPFSIFLFLITTPIEAFTDEKPTTHLGVFHNLWSNTKDSFVGENLYYHGASFGSTYIIAKSGIDKRMYNYSLKDPIGEVYGDWALIFGALWQPVIGGVLYLSSDLETKTAGSAVLQTMLVQSVYVTLLKGLTGRPDPVQGGDIINANEKGTTCGNSFDPEIFFDLTKGCSWPSGHTASAVSLVSTLYAFYPEKKWIAYFDLYTPAVESPLISKVIKSGDSTAGV